MACTPPQTPPSHSRRRRAVWSAPSWGAAAILGVAGLSHVKPALAARSCEAWSAAVSVVEGRVEVRRSTTTTWVALAAGDRLCTDDLVRVDGASRVTLLLSDGGTIKLDEHSVLNLPEPPSGTGSLLELLRGMLHVISRDPRSLTFKTPYANAGLEGTEFDIRVDTDERLTEIVVLEGVVPTQTPNGNLA